MRFIKRIISTTVSLLKLLISFHFIRSFSGMVLMGGTFSAYNQRYAKGKIAGFKEYVKCTTPKEYAPASACIGCGKCEQHCPQSIEIRNQLKNAENELEGSAYKAVLKIKKKK